MKVKMILLSVAVLLIAEATLWAGLGSDKTMYIGGTVPALKEGTEGRSSTQDEKIFVFTYKGGELKIPYDRVNDLEYGQKAGRRLGLAIAVSPLALFSKKRRHYLTIGYQDENDKQQAAVFESFESRWPASRREPAARSNIKTKRPARAVRAFRRSL